MSDKEKFEKLKKKVAKSGYVSLDGEERKEYSKLKQELSESSPTPQDESQPKPAEQTITMTPAELEALMQRTINNHEKSKGGDKPMPEANYNEWAEVGEEKKPNRTATLRLYQKDTRSPWGVIIRSDYLKTVFNEETRKMDKALYEVEVLYDDNKTDVFEIDDNEFIKLNQREVVELIETDRKRLRKVSGTVGVPAKDKDGYPVASANSGGYGSAQGYVGEVPLEDIKYNEFFTIKRPNGQTVKIHSKHLNA